MSITSASTSETPTRRRTRNAILTSAIGVLTQNQSASLGDIADAAHVARSTLHRYFPDRAALLSAVREFAEEEIAAASVRARIEEGSAAEALVRLCHEYFDYWHMIMWVYMESLREECGVDTFNAAVDPTIGALIARGYEDGTIDPSLPNAWIQHLLWALLYSAWEYVQQGESKHDALALALNSLGKLIRPEQQSVIIPPVIQNGL
jgi:AcrR family transcriptional regulator